MKVSYCVIFSIISFAFFSCFPDQQKIDDTKKYSSKYTIELNSLTTTDYPDDPDLGYYSKHKDEISHKKLLIEANQNENFSLTVLPANNLSDTIIIPDIELKTFLMAVPDRINQDPYLTKIAIINQEWNRQQVRFPKSLKKYEIRGSGIEKQITRIDLARNCLNTPLWEIVFFIEEDGTEKPLYHGWFNFPINLYKQLFYNQTQLSFDNYQEHLLTWKDPESKKINYNLLREIKDILAIDFENYNHNYYPLTGARIKKEKNIIAPKVHHSINDFLTDSTLYATFSPPGFYNTQDPRVTELGRLHNINKIEIKEINIPSIDTSSLLHEITIYYCDLNNERNTIWTLGGIDLKSLPILSLQEHNKGFKMPMGIGNHPFYENYKKSINNPIVNNPYYSLLTDEKGNFLDSHKIGVDGPILFWDNEDNNLLHIMLLSFERHSFVGHYGIRVDRKKI